VRALVLVALLGACSFEADYGGSRYRCAGDAGGCPPGFMCMASGYCVVPGSVDAAPGDLDAGPDGIDADPDQPDAASVDVCTEAAAAPAADTCADGDARDLTDAARQPGGFVVYGDTTEHGNTLQSPSSGCGAIGVITTGNDAIYTVELAVGERLSARLFTEGWDSVLYLAPSCSNSSTACAAADDAPFDDNGTMTQAVEEIVHTAGEAGTLYLVVDSKRIDSNDYSVGCFTLEVAITN
jgi:hypothetical protein